MMPSLREQLRDEFEETLETRMSEPKTMRPMVQLGIEAEVESVSESESELDSESECDPDHGPQEEVPVQQAPVAVPPFKTFRGHLEDAVDWAYNERWTNFTWGLYVGLVVPRLGWGILCVVWSFPTAIVFKHPEWFSSPIDRGDLLTILMYCILTEAMAMYYISKVLN